MAVPVPYRCDDKYPIFQSFKDEQTGKKAFPEDLPAHASSRTDIAKFAKEAKALGIQYVGPCCGNASHYLRVLAEGYGRTPPASRFSPNMKEHFIYGDGSARQKSYYTEGLRSTMT